MKNKRKLIEKSKNFILNHVGGSVVEYALILGFSIFIFIIVVGIILSITNNLETMLDDLFVSI